MKAIKIFTTTIMAGAALTLMLSSCSKFEEDNIFEQSAAERLESSKTKYSTALAAEGGKWEMLYFANGDEEGCLMYMEFGADGSVTMGCQNPAVNRGVMTIEKSAWEVLTDNGPVLSFNSFNHVLHAYSNPEDISGTEDDETGRGHEGDYEFNIIKIDDNRAELKGKKRGYTIVMNRLDAATDPVVFLTAATNFRNALLNEAIEKHTLVYNDTAIYNIENASSGVMDIYPDGSDAVMSTVQRSFVVSSNGLRFITPLKSDDGMDVQEFTMSEDKSYLVNAAGNARIQAKWGNYVSNLLISEAWTISNWSSQVGDVLNRIDSELKKFNADYSVAGLHTGYSTGKGAVSGLVLQFYTNLEKTKLNDTAIEMEYSMSGDKLVIATGSNATDDNMKTLATKATNLPALMQELANAIAGTYTLTPDNYFVPAAVDLKSDNGVTMTMTAPDEDERN